MFKKYVTVGGLMLTLAWAVPARASDVTFNPGGGVGPNVTIDQLLYQTGNLLTAGLSATATVGQTFESYYQANLAGAYLTVGGTETSQYLNGSNGVFYTIVASLPEVVQSTSGGTNPNIGFELGSGGANVFTIYANNVAGDNLSGTCFVCGTPILTAVENDPVGTVLGSFFVTSETPTALQGPSSPADGRAAYSGVGSVSGTGSTNLDFKVLTDNNAYFPGLSAGSTFLVSLVSENVPFATTDASACIQSVTETGPDASATCTGGLGQVGVGSVGPLNGFSGPNSIVETHGSNAFITTATVPEPATLTLLGVGLLAGARRRMKAAKK